MKTKSLFNPSTDKKQNTLILLVYWFISNRHNQLIFEGLKKLRENTNDIALRIVCLNPFNPQEDIVQYQKNMLLNFEMSYDEKRTAMFYHINSFPSFIVMEKSGKILHRENGLSDTCFENLENCIIKNTAQENASQKGKIIPIDSYKNNLSFLLKKI